MGRVFDQGELGEESVESLFAGVAFFAAIFEVGNLRQYTEINDVVPEQMTSGKMQNNEMQNKKRLLMNIDAANKRRLVAG